MIKQLKKYDVQNTPFIATKSWNLLNVGNEDLLETEDGLNTFAIEFVDYNFGNPFGFLSLGCSLALEQQTQDIVDLEEGLSGSGFFHLSDPQNPSGTYKRLVYQQVLRAFYNNYHNPLQIFGLEKIDFQTSGLQRYLSTEFKIFKLPQLSFGDKIAPGSVVFEDNTLDDNFIIADDSLGNLIASPNLFSRSQEVRHITNNVISGSFNMNCPPPMTVLPTAPVLQAFVLSTSSSFEVWTDVSSSTGYLLYRSIDSGSTWQLIASTLEPQTSSIDAAIDLMLTSSYSYKVQGYNVVGLGPFSNTASIFSIAGPFNLTAISGAGLTCDTSAFAAQLFTSSLDTTLTYDIS